MTGGLGLGAEQDLFAGESSEFSCMTHSFKCRPSHTRLKMIFMWSADRFRAEADEEGNGREPATDGAPA